jgi:hypothetical protein
MSVQLSAFENEIYIFLLENLPTNDVATIYEFQLEGQENSNHAIAYSPLNGEDEYNFVFSLGRHSQNVFITIANGDTKEIARAVANIEDCDVEKGGLSLDDFVDLDINIFRRNGWKGVLLMPVSLLGTLESFPLCKVISGNYVNFFLAVLISHDEYCCMKSSGIEALMEKFDEEGKDIIGNLKYGR